MLGRRDLIEGRDGARYQAMDAASRLREDGIVMARRNITELTALTRELSEKVQGLEADDTRSAR